MARISKVVKDLIRKANKKADERKRQKQAKSELISVATAIRRSSGRVTISGMIIGVSTVVQNDNGN
jgi:hypothetical protein